MNHKITVLLMLIVFFFGCQSEKEEAFPQELIGLWETEAPRYDGCSFEIVDDQIIFSNRHEDYMDINRITGIEKSLAQGKNLYHIEFENREGLEYKISLLYMKSKGRDVVQFKNQEDVQWIKKAE